MQRAPRFFLSDQHSNEDGGFSGVLVSGCCSRFLRTSLNKSNKRHAIASLFLNVTNTPMKTEDFQFFWRPGVVKDVHKIYQTAPGVPKKVE